MHLQKSAFKPKPKSQAVPTVILRFRAQQRLIAVTPKVPTVSVKSVDVLSSRHAVQFDSVTLFSLTRQDSLL